MKRANELPMKQENQFSEIVSLIRQARDNAYKEVNKELINCYWIVGGYISQRIAAASWGNKTINDLAKFIEKNHPELKGYERRNLYRMKQFYDTYKNLSIVSPPVTQLQNNNNQSIEFVAPLVRQLDIKETILAQISWTHHLIIFSRAKTDEEREFYIRLSIRENYSKRELDRQISSGVFERVMLGHQKLPQPVKELNKGQIANFKDSYVFDFLNLPKEHSESDLQKALIAQMKDFLLELGRDFIFIGEEYRIQVGNSDFEIDLLFFHRSLQCLVAFELKAEKFKPEHLGQLNFLYVYLGMRRKIR